MMGENERQAKIKTTDAAARQHTESALDAARQKTSRLKAERVAQGAAGPVAEEPRGPQVEKPKRRARAPKASMLPNQLKAENDG